ncbi:tRNA(fMet)-specific endonuclease VapC [Halopenitus malekzadehii]|uniref:Ribonuclease VapC n=1 Tax=Halopenitus malekzadehii TaxID=1267564 RepID=A0A1H6HZV2_9EURY|nr:PIN domain-containing protein [Halopenitus malekzadehii]SEH40672.1 tRNA(fMet)-specific endonuclease VapC [Halopenitus malekzadehii]
MHCLGANALIDYLEGEPKIATFLEETDRRPLFASTIALHEVFVGAARLRGRSGVADARSDLDWVEPLELSPGGAAEAAVIDAELRDAGTPIGAMDTIIAGTVRDAGATLVTADGHFDAVRDLDVRRYR